MPVANWLKYYSQNLRGVVVSMEAIFPCLNLKHDDGYLLYNMSEVFNKTGHGLSDIIIAWAEFKPLLHPVFWAERYIHLLSTRVELKALHGWGLCQKSLEYLVWIKMHFTAGLSPFYKSCSTKIRLNIWVAIPKEWYEYTGYIRIILGTIVSYSKLATMILVHWLSQFVQGTYTWKPLAGISPAEMELTFSEIYPKSMSDGNITEKNLMW